MRALQGSRRPSGMHRAISRCAGGGRMCVASCVRRVIACISKERKGGNAPFDCFCVFRGKRPSRDEMWARCFERLTLEHAYAALLELLQVGPHKLP